MIRRLVAAYACRCGGSRLYAKPLQNLEPGTTILDHLLAATRQAPEIADIVLGIAEGSENLPFAEVARREGIHYIVGSEKDVLWRLIACGRVVGATDVFRVTTECPFVAWELVAEAWRRHIEEGNDVTASDFLPEGCNFEIYRLSALERSHVEGIDAERSEFCSAYARRRHDLFKIGVVVPPPAQRRTDLRLTVDYPEDLIVCREVYRALKIEAPRIPMQDIMAFLDNRADLKALVASYVDPTPVWAHCIK